MRPITDIVIVGSGNVAEALAAAVAAAEGVVLRGVAARNGARAAEIADMAGGVWHGPIGEAPDAGLYLIAVSDRAVAEAAAALPHRAGAVAAHTAGSVAADVLRGAGFAACGVVYPFQTFTAGRRVDFARVPLFVEGSDEEVTRRLEAFAARLSRTVRRASSERRRTIHLAGVLACNFVNALYSMAADTLASREGLPADVLHPLIEETARKAVYMAHPRDGQTGPAVRGDRAVAERHEAMLEGEPLQREIYRLLTEYIWETSRKI